MPPSSHTLPRPTLITFDIFGTVLDWRRGFAQAASSANRPLADGWFGALIDTQAQLEQTSPTERYADIAAESLMRVLGFTEAEARAVGARLGAFPPFPDSVAALRSISQHVACGAITNSDRSHRDQVRQAFGDSFVHWICAEDMGLYKPDRRCWERASAVFGVPLGAWWWHASAYADYDLQVAREVGLTPIFVQRPHARPGEADAAFSDLSELAAWVSRLPPGPGNSPQTRGF